MITKCLNRIITEQELSGAHICNFLFGFSDKKCPNSFCTLNIHSFLAWVDNNEFNCSDNVADAAAAGDDDVREDTFMVAEGNQGLVLVNQLTDYLNRGDNLAHLSLYNYVSTVYKGKLDKEEERKMSKFSESDGRAKVGRPVHGRYHFLPQHPQSDTHIQRVRSQPIIPSLSLIPPLKESDATKFYKIMLILFHPFSRFNDLYDGVSWESSYSNYTFEDDAVFVRNIEEMHVGIKEREDSGVRDGENDDNNELSSENDDEDIDFKWIVML